MRYIDRVTANNNKNESEKDMKAERNKVTVLSAMNLYVRLLNGGWVNIYSEKVPVKLAVAIRRDATVAAQSGIRGGEVKYAGRSFNWEAVQ